jgi:hypothetical protein
MMEQRRKSPRNEHGFIMERQSLEIRSRSETHSIVSVPCACSNGFSTFFPFHCSSVLRSSAIATILENDIGY